MAPAHATPSQSSGPLASARPRDGRAGEGRLRELDALRGLAALAVVLYHYTVRYGELFSAPRPAWQFTGGSYGVEVFFGISGFVILMTLQRSRTAYDFLVSRFSRLYPAYWVCVGLTMVTLTLLPLPGRQVGWWDALANLTMWQEMWRIPHVDGVYWSLQVELIFYAMMLAAWSVGGLKYARTLLIAWLLVALGTVFGAHALGRGVPYVAERFLLLGYSAFFAIGAAAFLDFEGRRVSRQTLVVFALAAATAWAWKGAGGFVVALGMVALFTLLVLRRARWLDRPALVWLGAISYPLYLLHQNIGYAVMRRLNGDGVWQPVAMGAAIVVSVALAAGVTFLVERPALTWLRGRLRRPPVKRDVAEPVSPTSA